MRKASWPGLNVFVIQNEIGKGTDITHQLHEFVVDCFEYCIISAATKDPSVFGCS